MQRKKDKYHSFRENKNWNKCFDNIEKSLDKMFNIDTRLVLDIDCSEGLTYCAYCCAWMVKEINKSNENAIFFIIKSLSIERNINRLLWFVWSKNSNLVSIINWMIRFKIFILR